MYISVSSRVESSYAKDTNRSLSISSCTEQVSNTHASQPMLHRVLSHACTCTCYCFVVMVAIAADEVQDAKTIVHLTRNQSFGVNFEIKLVMK